MRKDITKLLCETPRYPGFRDMRGKEKTFHKKCLRRALHDAEHIDEGFVRSPLRARNERTKESREYLRPLVRFLEKRVGYLWNEVYGEIREVADKNSAIRYHVFQHLVDYVNLKTFIGEDGKVYAHLGFRRDGSFCICVEEANYFFDFFYVHPVTHRLHMVPRFKRKKEKTPKYFAKDHFVEVINGKRVVCSTLYKKVNGEWKVVFVKEMPSDRIVDEYSESEKYPDFLFPNGLNYWGRNSEYGQRNFVSYGMRDVGVREQRELSKLLKG